MQKCLGERLNTECGLMLVKERSHKVSLCHSQRDSLLPAVGRYLSIHSVSTKLSPIKLPFPSAGSICDISLITSLCACVQHVPPPFNVQGCYISSATDLLPSVQTRRWLAGGDDDLNVLIKSAHQRQQLLPGVTLYSPGYSCKHVLLAVTLLTHILCGSNLHKSLI